MQIVHLPLSSLTPYAKNPRKNKKGIAAVKRSIEEFGFTQPIIVNAETIILCGHTRYEAAKELTLETVPVIIKTDLTPQQKRAYCIADNRVTEETDWDKWKLRSEFCELFSDGEYFTGFTQDEIGKIMSLDLGFRNQKEMSDMLPSMLFPVEIACNEKQWATFQEVQEKMKKIVRMNEEPYYPVDTDAVDDAEYEAELDELYPPESIAELMPQIEDALEELMSRSPKRAALAIERMSMVASKIMPILQAESEQDSRKEMESRDYVRQSLSSLTDETTEVLEELIATANKRTITTISHLAFVLSLIMPGLQAVSKQADSVLCQKYGVTFDEEQIGGNDHNSIQGSLLTNSSKKISIEGNDAADEFYPDEIRPATNRIEGARTQVLVNRYERNPEARKDCIQRQGVTCVVCGFNFEKQYGDIGKGFIHVHHLKEISDIAEEYVVNPDNDLRPVCPNCHAMVHKLKSISGIEAIDELCKIVETNRQ